MHKERGGGLLVKDEVDKLISAARLERWSVINEEILPKISKIPNGDVVAEELLKYCNDDNPNIRDVVAIGLNTVDIIDQKVLKKSLDEMCIMATTDEDKFPAANAALFLSKFRQNKSYKIMVEDALQDFKNLVNSEGWRGEVEEKIPQLRLILRG